MISTRWYQKVLVTLIIIGGLLSAQASFVLAQPVNRPLPQQDHSKDLPPEFQPALDAVVRVNRNQGGFGSGVIIRNSDNGRYYVLTNNHVVEGNSTMVITLANGSTLSATVLKAPAPSRKSDLALLEIDTNKDLPYLPLATVDEFKTLKRGDTVCYIGASGADPTIHGHMCAVINPKIRNNLFENALSVDRGVGGGHSGGAVAAIINGELNAVALTANREGEPGDPNARGFGPSLIEIKNYLGLLYEYFTQSKQPISDEEKEHRRLVEELIRLLYADQIPTVIEIGRARDKNNPDTPNSTYRKLKELEKSGAIKFTYLDTSNCKDLGGNKYECEVDGKKMITDFDKKGGPPMIVVVDVNERKEIYGGRAIDQFINEQRGGGSAPSNAKVVIYTRPNCPYCDDLIKYLKANNISYQELTASPSLQIPIITIDGEEVGVGFDKDNPPQELQKLAGQSGGSSRPTPQPIPPNNRPGNPPPNGVQPPGLPAPRPGYWWAPFGNGFIEVPIR